MNSQTVHKIARILMVALGVILVLIIGVRIGMKSNRSNNPIVNERPNAFGTVAEFSFVNQSAKAFGLTDLKGSVWIADFIFTRCAGPCPIVTTKMAGLNKEFSENPELKFVSFSVDPDYDQPEVLTKYAQTYGADLNRWTFLTAKKSDIYNLITKSFRLAVEPTTVETDIIHSLHFVLIDKDGTIRGYYNSTDADEVERLKKDTRALLSHV